MVRVIPSPLSMVAIPRALPQVSKHSPTTFAPASIDPAHARVNRLSAPPAPRSGVPLPAPFRPPTALVAPSPAVCATSTTQPPSPPVLRRLAPPRSLRPPTRPHAASALTASPGGPVAHGPARASRPFERRCRRVRSITAGSWISAITRIGPSHRGHASGPTAATQRPARAVHAGRHSHAGRAILPGVGLQMAAHVAKMET
jgi:hypothetical protein